MRQVTKFYITSFLKNQTYFTPILIVFLLFHALSYQQIFWVFTIGSIFALIIEIPTGALADVFGKRRSIIISKFGIFVSYIIFGFSTKFWMFVAAQLVYELGNAFRSGTETAYTFDYLKQNKKNNPSYTEVKGKQKFWARVGEAIATATGGLLAKYLGYNWVFFIAAIPAFLNFLLAIAWEEIKERKESITKIKEYINITKESIVDLVKRNLVLRIVLNIMIFTAVLAALNKFIQPYMTDAQIPIEWFGFIYSAFLIITAIAVRYSYIVEDKFGTIKTINTLSVLAVIPAVIVGLGHVSLAGVFLFFIIVIIENIRSPIANNEFHTLVKSSNRATMGSILALFKSLGKIAILPIAGYFADAFSLYTSVLILSGALLLNSILFYIKQPKHRKQ